MTYIPNIPIATESPANQVVQIQTNFAQFAAKFSSLVAGVRNNHTAFNNINQGDHESIILQKQISDPGVTQNLDVLYCKDAASTSGTQPQLFVQIPQFVPDHANFPMQLTYNQVNTAGPQYQTFLAGGYLFYFSTTNNLPQIITLSPTPSSVLMAIAQANNVTSNVNFVPVDVEIKVDPATKKVTISSNIAIAPNIFSWMVIGTV